MNDMNLQGIPAGLAQAYALAQQQGLPINNATIQQVYDSLMRNSTGEQLNTAQHFNNATSQLNNATEAFDRITAMLNGVPGLETSHVSGETTNETSPAAEGLSTQSPTVFSPAAQPWYYNTDLRSSQVGGARNEVSGVRAKVAQPSTITQQPTHSEVSESSASEPDADADDARTTAQTAQQQVGTSDTGNPIDAMLATIPGFAAARAMRNSQPPFIDAPKQLVAQQRALPAPSVEDVIVSNIPELSTSQRTQIPSQVTDMPTATGSVIEAPDPTKLATQHGVFTERRGNQTQQPRRPDVIEAGAPKQPVKAQAASHNKSQATADVQNNEGDLVDNSTPRSSADKLADSVAEKTASSDKPKRIQPRDMSGITNKFKVALANNAPDYEQVSIERAATRGRGGATELVVKKGDEVLGRYKSADALMEAVKDIAAALKRLR